MRLLAMLFAACVAMTTPIGAAEPDYRSATEALLRNKAGQLACFPIDAVASRVFVLHTYYGGYGKPKVAPAPGRQPVSVVDVDIAFTDEPVLVIAVAYEPQIWRFMLAPGVRLAGVQLLGANEQYVDGLPAGTPLGRIYETSRDGEALPCGDPERAAARRKAHEELSYLANLVDDQQRSFEVARTRADYYVQFYTELTRRAAEAETPPLSDGTDPETGALVSETRQAAAEEVLALARSLAVDAGDRRSRMLDRVAETRSEQSKALRSVARLDEDGRMPPPFDGWFTIEYKDDLNDLLAAIHMFGPYIFAGYRFLESTEEDSFAIRPNGSIGPDPTSRELPHRPVTY